MSITFRGTYRDLGSFSASGAHPAVTGTVTITPAGGAETEETLDAAGKYEVVLPSFSGKVTVVETITGLDDPIETVYEVIDRTTTDTSKDIHIPTGVGDLPPGAYATPAYVNSAISALSGTYAGSPTPGTARTALVTDAVDQSRAGNTTFTGHGYFASGRPWVDVRGKGATGTAGENQKTALQAAFTVALTLGKATVYFPEGDYETDGFLTVYSNTHVRMAAGATIKPHSTWSGSSLFVLSARTGIRWQGGTVDATTHASISQAFLFTNCSSVELSQVTVTNLRTASNSANIRITGSDGIYIDRCTLTNGFRGVWTTNNTTTWSKNVHVTRSTFSTFTEQGTYFAGDANGATEDCLISDNTMRVISGGTAKQPLYFTTGGTTRHRRPRIIGNRLFGNGTGFSAGGNGDLLAAYDLEDGQVDGNFTTDGGDIGISVWRSVRTQVRGNHCWNNWTPGISVWDCTDTSLVGNHCWNNFKAFGTLGGPYGGIMLRADAPGGTSDTLVTGNRCFDNQGSKTQDYGISIEANVVKTYLGTNDFTGNRLGDILNNSSENVGRAGEDTLGYGIVCNADPGSMQGNMGMAIANDTIYYRTKAAGLISAIALHVGVQSGNISVSVHRNSGTGRSAVPGAQARTSGAVACPAPGFASIALASAVYVHPGDWLALSADNTTATFRAADTAGGASDLSLGVRYRQGTAHPTPATPASLQATGGRTVVLVGVP